LVKDPSCRVSLELCTSLMTQLRGALLMLDKLRAVALMDTLLEYLNGYDTVEFFDVNKLDSLFQVVVSLASYLEVLGESRTDGDKILDMADNQLSTFLVPVSTLTKVSSSERFDSSVEKDVIEVDPTAHKTRSTIRIDRAQNSWAGRTNRSIVRTKEKDNLPKKGRIVPKHSKYRP
jgi:hypothetical protein